MDSLDLTILSALIQKGRMSWADLAQKVGLSAPGLMDRVRRLEEKKIIQGYRAVVDPAALGITLTAFVSVSIDRPSHRANFLKRVRHLVEIQECHQVTGDDDFLLKIKCHHTRHLDQVLNVGIKALPGVVRTRTTIVLGTEKEGQEFVFPESLNEEVS